MHDFNDMWFCDIVDSIVATSEPLRGTIYTIPKLKYEVKDVMYNPPATIVWFNDGDKVVSKCDKVDTFSKEVGFMTCLLKKYLGKKEFYKLMEKYVYNKED